MAARPFNQPHEHYNTGMKSIGSIENDNSIAWHLVFGLSTDAWSHTSEPELAAFCTFIGHMCKCPFKFAVREFSAMTCSFCGEPDMFKFCSNNLWQWTLQYGSSGDLNMKIYSAGVNDAELHSALFLIVPSIGFFILRYILTNNWQKLMAFVLTFPSTWTNSHRKFHIALHLKFIFHLRPGIFLHATEVICATDVTDIESPKKIELSTRLYDDVSICHYQWELTLSNLFILRKVLCYLFLGEGFCSDSHHLTVWQIGPRIPTTFPRRHPSSHPMWKHWLSSSISRQPIDVQNDANHQIQLRKSGFYLDGTMMNNGTSTERYLFLEHLLQLTFAERTQ